MTAPEFPPLDVITLSRAEMLALADTLALAAQQHRVVRVAVDFDGFKAKVDNFTWSPPMGKREQT